MLQKTSLYKVKNMYTNEKEHCRDSLNQVSFFFVRREYTCNNKINMQNKFVRSV